MRAERLEQFVSGDRRVLMSRQLQDRLDATLVKFERVELQERKAVLDLIVRLKW